MSLHPTTQVLMVSGKHYFHCVAEARFSCAPITANLSGECNYYLAFISISHTEICAVRMLEHERAHAGLRIHHESFGELHANLFGPQNLPDARLILQVRAGRIPEAVTLAAIF